MLKKTIGVIVSFVFLSIFLSQTPSFWQSADEVLSGQSAVSEDTSPGSAVPFISAAQAQGGGSNPTAEAGFDRTVAVGATATLDGSRSTTASSKVLDFDWTMTSRPAGSSAVLNDTTALPGHIIARSPSKKQLAIAECSKGETPNSCISV